MPNFAFVVEGPPVSVNAKDKNPKRYQAWIKTVREAARTVWQSGSDPLPLTVDVAVEVVNYFTLPPIDVDNVLKPVLDALCGVVYKDDAQVSRVVSERLRADDLEDAEPEIIAAALRYSEFLYVVVLWE